MSGALALVAAGVLALVAEPALAAPGGSPRSGALSWSMIDTGSTAHLRGLAPVSRSVIWASGTEGTILRTTDGGATIEDVGPVDTDGLQFRSLYASSPDHAVAVSIGDNPDDMRVYVTDDGGLTWSMALQNQEPTGFFDCLTFVDKKTGYLLGDPIDGKFQVIKTTDGGHTWLVLPENGMPPTPDEYGFAASGTCIQSNDRGDLFIGTGGADPARILVSKDQGHTWTVQNSPVAGGASSGIFSLSFGNGRGGVAVGGDYLMADTVEEVAAWTDDQGATWHPATGLGGYRAGSAWVDSAAAVVIAVGPTGSDVSRDGGRSYTSIDTGSFDAVACVPTACFASGESGRLARLTSN
ncbi:MAG: oxidoreductase [Nostocoides sp.]